MAKISGSISNFANGVSQQAAALRLATQGIYQNNAYSTVVDGLRKRPPTQRQAYLGPPEQFSGNVFTHMINRDADERYTVLMTSTDIRVFDLDGNEKTVNAPDGFSYLDDPVDGTASYRAITVADYTYVTNMTKVTALDDTVVEAASNSEAIVHVLAGNYGNTYIIKIDGVEVAKYRTPDGTSAAQSPAVDAAFIADRLATGATVSLETTVNDEPNGNWTWKSSDTSLDDEGIDDAGGWTVNVYNSAIYIKKNNGDPFTIEVQDGYNGNAMIAVKDEVQDFADLPYYCEDGMSVEVVGSPGNEFDNYYVRFETTSTGTSMGVWKEIPKPGIVKEFDTSTMPHALVRESDGTFTFKALEWDARKAGDDDTAPAPSFIGKPINELTFFKNRLGFLSGESVIMSRSGSYFDFWRATATALLDDDPIDIASTHAGVSILRSAVAFSDRLVLFSDQTQFNVRGNELFTPKTASIRATTSYASSSRARPAASGDVVFFPADRGQFSMMREYAIDEDTGKVSADDITGHVPQYVPANISRMSASTHEDILTVLSDDEPDALYVYKYYWADKRKLQSSWSRWDFPGVTKVMDTAFIDSRLFVIVLRPTGVFIEVLDVQPGGVDEGARFIVHLDRRFEITQSETSSYDFESDTTTVPLPYDITDADYSCVTGGFAASDVEPGLELKIVDKNSWSVTLQGDQRDIPLYFGTTYETRYRISPIYIRAKSEGGGTMVITEGRLQLLHLLIQYSETAYFRVEVTPLARETRTYENAGRLMGDPDNRVDFVNLSDGSFKVPVLSRNDRVQIDLVNDSYLPSSFLSAEWVGNYVQRSRRI